MIYVYLLVVAVSMAVSIAAFWTLLNRTPKPTPARRSARDRAEVRMRATVPREA